MPDYVGHIFALTLPKLQRPNPGADYCSPTTPNRWNSALPARLPGRPSNEDRRRAALQGPVNRERRKVGLGQEAVESAASRLRHQPAFREDGRGTNARLSRDASVVKLTMGFGEVLFRDLGPSAVTLGPASEGAASAKRRLLHDDKTGALEVLDEALGDDDRHELVGVVDPLAALKTQREGQRVGDIGGGGGS